MNLKFGKRKTETLRKDHSFLVTKMYYLEFKTIRKIHRIGFIIPMADRISVSKFRFYFYFIIKGDVGEQYRFLWFAYSWIEKR
jgi:hypothetical protein